MVVLLSGRNLAGEENTVGGLLMAGTSPAARETEPAHEVQSYPQDFLISGKIPLGATPKAGAASALVASKRRAGNGRKLLATATAKAADIRKDDHR
jgi:hypothetical protein